MSSKEEKFMNPLKLFNTTLFSRDVCEKINCDPLPEDFIRNFKSQIDWNYLQLPEKKEKD